jgi:hypothetical protein
MRGGRIPGGRHHKRRLAPLERWVLVALAVGVAALWLPVAVGAVAPLAGGAADQAAGTLADCAARTGRLSVVLLIDESASLRRTDPADQRVQAVQAALVGLAAAAERTKTGERPVSVEVALVGFGADTTTVVGWTPLDGGTVGGLVVEAARFAERDGQIDTDYVAALLAAREELARVADPATPGGACTAILWFTDGEYDIEARATGETKPYAPDLPLTGPEAATALEERGRDLLCRDGGLVDALRGEGTAILAVALSSAIPAPDRDFLRALAEGEAEGLRCGAARPAGSPPPGAYLQTEDVGQLTSRFVELVNDLAGGTPLPGGEDVPVCPSEACERGTHTCTVDPGIRSFNLLAVTSAPGIDVELRSPEPGAAPLALSADRPTGEAPVGSAVARWTWVALDSVLVDVRLPDDAGPWNGEWRVTFIDRTASTPDAVADARIYVFGDLEPWLEPTEFRAGEANEVRVGVRHREGTPVDESLFADVTLDAVVVDPADGRRWPVELGPADADGIRAGVWEAPAPEFPAAVNVSVTARVRTVSGQTLTPVTRSVAVEVRPPRDYPTVTPTEVRFGTVTGVETEEVVLRVRGGEASGGCVWVEPPRFTQTPADAGALSLVPEPAATGRDTCLAVAPGEERELRLRLTPTAAADGAAAGTLTVGLASDANPDLLRTEIAWRAGFERPVDTAKAVWLSVLLMVAGLVLPLVLMWVVNRLTARFASPGELKVAHLPVIVTGTGVVHRKDRATGGLAVAPVDFRAVDVAGSPSAFRVDVPVAPGTSRGGLPVAPGASRAGSLEFRARVPWWPLAAPSGEVRAEGCAVGSLPPATTGPTTATSPVPFGLAGTAVVSVPLAVLDAAVAATEPARAAAGMGRPDPGTRPLPGPSGAFADPPPGSDGRRRPDLEVGLWLFAPATGVSRYATHFDTHRDAVKAVVDTLVERRREELARGEAQQEEAPLPPPPPPSTDPGGPPPRAAKTGSTEPPPRTASSEVVGPPPRTTAPGVGGPPAPPGRAGRAPGADLSRPGRTSPTNRAATPSSGSDPFGPPPGRTR